MSRPHRSSRFTYAPITRGHKPTASQESNTLSTMSEVSCTTTLSLDSEVGARLGGFLEEGEQGGVANYRSGSEETVDTVIANTAYRGGKEDKKQQGGNKRMKSRNSDYGSYCGSPTTTGPLPVGGVPSVPAINRSAATPLLSSSECDDSEEEAVVAFSTSSTLPGHVKVDLPTSPANSSSSRIPGEPFKTLVAALFLGSGFLATTISLAFTHERVPDIAPLPDLVLDQVMGYQAWGLDVSEVLLMTNTLTAVLVAIFHSHRSIVLRRIWLILGVLYYYRAITMTVTVLPKADQYYECLPRQNTTTAMTYVNRVLTIASGGGLSINGKHVFCGDYIFSGHTMTLTLGYLAIKQYSPKRFLLLHWTSFITAICGVIFLLLARGHYTIDVILAYYVSSRLWWIYHTMAHNNNLKTRGPHNLLDNLWWWHIFSWFEDKTAGPLPRQYSLPLPQKFKRFFRRSILRRPCSGPPLQSVSTQDIREGV